MSKTLGKYEDNGVECEAKVSDHDTYVIVYSTKVGEDIPLPESQIKIPKEIFKLICLSASGECQS